MAITELVRRAREGTGTRTTSSSPSPSRERPQIDKARRFSDPYQLTSSGRCRCRHQESSAAWDGLRATASGSGNVEVTDVRVAGGTCSSSPAGGTILVAVGSLALSFMSTSNSALVPATGVVLGGSGAIRTVTITPVARESGTAVITLSLSDGTYTTSFTVTVIVGSDKNNTLAGTWSTPKRASP